MPDVRYADDATVENFSTYDPAPADRYYEKRPLFPEEVTEKPASKLRVTHTRLWDLFMAEWERQRDNRREMAVDEGFYDHQQWTETEEDLAEDLGHMPMTINVTKTMINWLLGTERRSRSDYKVLPRRKEGSAAAERKSHLLKYLSDVNRSEFAWSLAFAETVKAGISFVEAGVQEDDQGEPIYDRNESYRNCLWDSAGIDLDMEDSRYFFRFKWMDVDQACAFFEDVEDVDAARKAIEGAVEETIDIASDFLDDPAEDHENFVQGYGLEGGSIEVISRQRVRMIEAWIKLPVKERKMAGGDFRGEIYDEFSPGHVEEVESGRARIVERVTNRMFVVIFTSAGIVYSSPSPYRHNRFPFTPVWCYRYADTHLPYGMIRDVRDLQRDVNKRHAHALFMLVHQKIVMDQGAVDDVDALEDEVNRPTAIIQKRPGYHFEINVDKPEIEHHIAMMMRSIAMIQQVGGITEENLGREHTGKSGKAIIALQDQGALATAPIFDNLRLARQIHGEKMLSLCEQFMTEEKSFRITNKRGSASFYKINDGLPENDIIRTKADFIISEDSWQATLRQSGTAMLLETVQGLAATAPDLLMAIIDLIIEGMDIPNREEIVRRVRNITGQEDPDADPNAPDPERDARNAAKARAAEMQDRASEAEIAKMEAEAAEKGARADKASVEAQKLVRSMAGENIDTQTKALALALEILQSRPAAEMADAVLAGAGYKEPAVEEAAAMQAAQAAQQAQEAAAPAPQIAPETDPMAQPVA